MDALKLEDGKTYRSRAGAIVTVTLALPDDKFPYQGSNDCWFNENGRWLGDHIDHDNDLVSPAFPKPEPETAQEQASVLLSPNAEQRAEHIAQIIQRGMDMDLESVRAFIDLYDSAVGGKA